MGKLVRAGSYYYAVKKKADIALSRSDLDWLILRPSLLVDDPAIGTVSLGPPEFHGQVVRANVAETQPSLAETEKFCSARTNLAIQCANHGGTEDVGESAATIRGCRPKHYINAT